MNDVPVRHVSVSLSRRDTSLTPLGLAIGLTLLFLSIAVIGGVLSWRRIHFVRSDGIGKGKRRQRGASLKQENSELDEAGSQQQGEESSFSQHLQSRRAQLFDNSNQQKKHCRHSLQCPEHHRRNHHRPPNRSHKKCACRAARPFETQLLEEFVEVSYPGVVLKGPRIWLDERRNRRCGFQRPNGVMSAMDAPQLVEGEDGRRRYVWLNPRSASAVRQGFENRRCRRGCQRRVHRGCWRK